MGKEKLFCQSVKQRALSNQPTCTDAYIFRSLPSGCYAFLLRRHDLPHRLADCALLLLHHAGLEEGGDEDDVWLETGDLGPRADELDGGLAGVVVDDGDALVDWDGADDGVEDFLDEFVLLAGVVQEDPAAW